MPVQSRKAAWAAAGIFSVGAVAGLAAPNLLRTASTAPLTASAPAPTTTVSTAVKGAIPFTTAPNYRAIVAQNSPAVVGIQTAGEMKVSSQQQLPFGMSPFGGGGDN